MAHFAKLHGETLTEGNHHSGIIVSSQIPLGKVLKWLLRIANAVSATAIKDRLEFLSDWKEIYSRSLSAGLYLLVIMRHEKGANCAAPLGLWAVIHVC